MKLGLKASRLAKHERPASLECGNQARIYNLESKSPTNGIPATLRPWIQRFPFLTSPAPWYLCTLTGTLARSVGRTAQSQWYRSTDCPIPASSTAKPRKNSSCHRAPRAVVPVRRKGMVWSRLGNITSRIHLGTRTGRAYSKETAPANSRHSEWYRDMIPAMIPVALLGSTVYLVRETTVAVPSQGQDR